MVDEKKIDDPTLSEFYKAMEETNAEKIARETLAGISESSSDNEDFDIESGNEGAEDQLGDRVILSSGDQPSNNVKLRQ